MDETPSSIRDLIKKRVPIKKSRKTERGELLKYFAGKIDKTIPYVAFRLTKMSLQDLYHIKSACDDYERMGEPWSKAFYGSLKI